MSVFGQQTISELPENPQSLARIEAARKIANGDPFLMIPFNFFCTASEFNRPGPEVEPMRVFDNLYEIPSSTQQQTTIWALTTSEGIILIDAGQAGRLDAILAGLRQVGLDPANVEYILVAHGHGDHYANAAYFQENYGTRVGMGAEDWDALANPPAGRGGRGAAGPPPPKRDLVLAEGMPLRLGDQSVTNVEIPGHTQGSLAFIFEVRDNGQPHMAGLFGGTIMAMARIPSEGLRQYIRSVNHYLDIARKMNVDVLIQNHALFDEMPNRLARLRARRPGDPHPFVIANDDVTKFWNVISTCIEAELARRPGAGAN